MKIITTILAVLISVSSMYSQKETSKIEKFSQKVLQNVSKGNVWVMDVMKSYTGQGSTEWDFDYTEVVLARNSKGLPTLIETQEKIEGTSSWVNVYHAEISYFDNDTVYEYKLKEWDTNTNNWNSELSCYEEKDEDGKVLIYFMRVLDNDAQNFSAGNKELYTYNDNNKVINKQDIDWDWEAQTWLDWGKTDYTYDDAGNLILEIQQIKPGTTWNNYLKIEYSYNEDNQLIFEKEQLWDSEWADYSRTTYTYYENALLKDELFERFYTDTWENVVKNTFVYTSNGLLESLEEHNYEDTESSLLYVYTYNDDNQETTFFLYDWNGSEWILFYKVFDDYDENGNQLSFYSQMTDGTWNNFEKEEYTWLQFASISDLNNLQVNIYPNPVTNSLNIVSEEEFSIEIINITGQTIYNALETASQTKLDVSNYPAGTYFIRLYNPNSEKTIKFLKN